MLWYKLFLDLHEFKGSVSLPPLCLYPEVGWLSGTLTHLRSIYFELIFIKVIRFVCRFAVVAAVGYMWLPSWNHWMKRINHPLSSFSKRSQWYFVLLLFSCLSLGYGSDCILVDYKSIDKFRDSLKLESRGIVCWSVKANTTFLGSVCSGTLAPYITLFFSSCQDL